MTKFDVIVIGFGIGGKKLTAALAKEGKKVALIEKNELQYGGSCPNIACIPTKTLIEASKKGISFEDAFDYRSKVVDKLNTNSYEGFSSMGGVSLFTAKASFLSNKEVRITDEAGKTKDLSADTIIINAGSEPKYPDIEGLEETEEVYDSISLQREKGNEAVEHLGIIGAGGAGLEFASMYANFGSKVTVFNRDASILGNEEPEIAEAIIKDMEADGVEFINNFDTKKVSNKAGKVLVSDGDSTFEVDTLLVATGRKAQTEGLGLENTDIELEENGYIKVDKHAETTVDGIYAVGDITGGPLFTYISKDDGRVVWDALHQVEKPHTLEERDNLQYVYFLNPSFARIGLSEKEAKEKGFNVKTNVLETKTFPRANVEKQFRGKWKAVVDKDTDLILGVSLYSEIAEELINLVKLAMNHDVKASELANMVFTHPVWSENFNSLFDF